ncbi:trypco2 family protein [Streptomyces sp. NPDC050848]|uniref:trypco2 family protein n=1 Tax=Streptomyces sp. NPDC050848 TaxID=3155791 RepID=UPI0033D6C6A1
MSDTRGADGQWMDLADAVTLLRKQIAEAQRRLADPTGGGDKGVLFALGEITVELGLELTRSNGVNGGLRWSVISLGGKKESGTKDTHKLTVKLTPHTPDGREPDISDRE